MISFAHVNFNVLDLQKSLDFYRDALDLHIVREKEAKDKSFKLVYLSDKQESFQLELTWMRDRTEAYDLGEAEFHLAFSTDEYDALHKKHAAMGCISYENVAMGLYFITDPDGYWLEIIPQR
jgi:lactoylglutathione lyase